MLELHETAEARCVAHQMPSKTYLTNIVKSTCVHYVIIQENVVINKRKSFQQKTDWEDRVIFITSNATATYLSHELMHANVHYFNCTSVSFGTLTEKCTDAVSPAFLCDKNLSSDSVCIHFASSIFLRDVLQSNASIASFIRYNYYGSSETMSPAIYSKNVIPKIGHYVYLSSEKLTTKSLSFEFFMSILSLFGIAKIDCVYIHGTVQFNGKYWDFLMKRNLCVRWNYWPFAKHIWQQYVVGSLAHVADVARAQAILRFGGLHVDPDVYILQKLPDHYWRYEAVLGLDVNYACPKVDFIPKEVKSYINLGICLSKPNSRFFKLYQESQRNYYNELWLYNSGQKPFHIYEQNPRLAYLDPKIQVVCAGRRCCPSWAKTKQEAQLWSKNFDFWLNDTFSVHIVWSVDELAEPKAIRASQTPFGRIASHILAANNINLSEIEQLWERLNCRIKKSCINYAYTFFLCTVANT